MHAQRGLLYLVCHSVRPSVYDLSVATFSVATNNKAAKNAIPMGSVSHWLDFENGDLRICTALWRENQANKPIY